ncbi:MAG: hypothetical protein ABUL44_04485, partial [Flavobacterium sp.]
KEFPEDVLAAFEIIIKAHNLFIEKKEDFYIGLSNQFVKIMFSFDKGTLYSELRKTDDDFTFPIFGVFSHINKIQAHEWFQNVKIHQKTMSYPKFYLIEYAKLFENELATIFTGNFSWYSALRAALEYERHLVAIILGPQIDYNHPISQKFWKGDETWKQDLEQFIKEHGIKLDPNGN